MHPASLPEEIGPYRIDRLIGRGGMGEVYRGYDPRLDRAVALKRIKSDSRDLTGARERFRREGRALARVSHPSVVEVYDWIEADESDWLVMEFLQGKSLDRILSKGRLSLLKALEVSRDIAAGLAAVHDQGIVHRDLKPANIMLVPQDQVSSEQIANGRVKILDFGLAKRVVAMDGLTLTDTISKKGRIFGTVQFMSPEQAAGRSIDGRSDIFSLGVMTYNMLSGELPFGGGTPMEILTRICTETEIPLHQVDPTLPKPISELVHQMLKKEPRWRLQSATEAARDLDALAAACEERTTLSNRPTPIDQIAGHHGPSERPSINDRSTVIRTTVHPTERSAQIFEPRKIFVAYGQDQEEWAHDRLMPILKAARLEVSFMGPSQDRDLSTHRAERYQDRADHQILVISAASLADRTCRYLLDRATLQDPDLRQGGVIPLIREANNDEISPELRSSRSSIYLEDGNAGEERAWAEILSACQAGYEFSACGWLRARDESRRYLDRGQSVSLVVTGEIPWRALLDDLRRSKSGPGALTSIDLDNPTTHTLEGLVNEIFRALASDRQVFDQRAPLPELQRYLERVPRAPRLALMHFDRARRFDGDFFAALRYLIDQRLMVFLFQTRRPFAEVVPLDDPLSKIDLKTVHLGGPE